MPNRVIEGTQGVTASGSLTGGMLRLTAMLADSLDLYRLNLSINTNTVGTYTAYSIRGATWSGDVSGSAPSNISNPFPEVPETIQKALVRLTLLA